MGIINVEQLQREVLTADTELLNNRLDEIELLLMDMHISAYECDLLMEERYYIEQEINYRRAMENG